MEDCFLAGGTLKMQLSFAGKADLIWIILQIINNHAAQLCIERYTATITTVQQRNNLRVDHFTAIQIRIFKQPCFIFGNSWMLTHPKWFYQKYTILLLFVQQKLKPEIVNTCTDIKIFNWIFLVVPLFKNTFIDNCSVIPEWVLGETVSTKYLQRYVH